MRQDSTPSKQKVILRPLTSDTTSAMGWKGLGISSSPPSSSSWGLRPSRSASSRSCRSLQGKPEVRGQRSEFVPVAQSLLSNLSTTLFNGSVTLYAHLMTQKTAFSSGFYGINYSYTIQHLQEAPLLVLFLRRSGGQ